ncbi:MAG: hypothetical protein Q4P08_01240 [Eubacteriales bacterium]|nr:hypothetical protein [Eubacteriales bacterium]
MLILAITINLMDLLLGLLVLAGVAALVALAITLFRIAQTLKTVSEIATESKPAVKLILDEVPITINRVQGILSDVEKVSSAAGESLPPLVKSAAEAGESITDTVGVIGDGAHTAVSAVSNFFKRIGKEKQVDFNLADKSISFGAPHKGKANLTQVAGAAIGAYRFVQKMKKAKKAAERKKKFGF